MNYEQLPSELVIESTITNLKSHGFEAVAVATREVALELLKKSIPQGAAITSGGSKTLTEIGFNDYLKAGKHGWNNLKDAILTETDPKRQALLRKQSVLADYYIGSANAVSETGELVFASGTGSQIPSIAFTSDTILLVVGTNKIAPTLGAALERLRNHVVPLEDQRQKDLGNAGTLLSKILVYEKHPNKFGKRVLVIFVKEKLGF